MPCLYDFFCFIQDEVVSALAMPIEVTFDSQEEFQAIFDQCQEAFLRQYETEEHNCGICSRDLLGEKFFFLSGCEHQFCK